MYMRARLPMLIMTTGLALLGDTNLRKECPAQGMAFKMIVRKGDNVRKGWPAQGDDLRKARDAHSY